MTKGQTETLGDNGYVYYLGCGNCFTDIYLYQIVTKCIPKYMQFIVCQVYFSKVGKNCTVSLF